MCVLGMGTAISYGKMMRSSPGGEAQRDDKIFFWSRADADSVCTKGPPYLPVPRCLQPENHSLTGTAPTKVS